MENAVAAPVHALSARGYGKAPFRCVGVFVMPSKSLAEHNPSAYASAMQNIPRGWGIGSCAICGMGLTYNYMVKSADGCKFTVGCDCVSKISDSNLLGEVRKARREYAMQLREAGRAEARKLRAESREAERKERVAHLLATHGEFLARCEATGYEYVKSIVASAKESGRISERMWAVLHSALERKEQEAKQVNEYVGEVGKRMECELTCERVIVLGHPDDRFGCKFLHIMVDADGRAFKYVGTSNAVPNKNQTRRLKFTVQEHAEHNGRKQTVIGRPMEIKPKVEAA